ncbi:hypothetical protein D779_2645 [Imhoffiella purpurea]|uniref:CheW-like domain-containing protein n=1 Tax=Imhoffiella purpurea TaxID=1249627 RepID=W9V5A0_9GAMM|nr:hypothetical protein D779_2645 [Imhoffiella purpurea]
MRAVIGQGNLIQLMHAPDMHEVPFCPDYCRHILAWEHGLLPLFDLSVWLRGQPRQRPLSCVGVVAFRGEDPAPRFGALALAAPPKRIDVDDAWACDLPESEMRWQPVCCSCFETGGEPFPILDLRRFFDLRPEPVGP